MCLLLFCVLKQKEKVAKGVHHSNLILITTQTTKRGASKDTLKRFCNNNTSFMLRGTDNKIGVGV